MERARSPDIVRQAMEALVDAGGYEKYVVT
jgi:hypothetical protein